MHTSQVNTPVLLKKALIKIINAALFEVSGYFDWTFALIKTHLNKFVGKSLVRLVILALKFA
jgi:hypothetical protein